MQETERQAEFEKLADELADQRDALQEQIEADERAGSVRDEEMQIVASMADLAEQLRRREEQVAESEIGLDLDRGQLDREAAELKQLRLRLEARRGRQDAIESHWRSELGRRDVDLQMRARDIECRENVLTELFGVA